MFDPRIHGDADARGASVDFAVNVASHTPAWLQQAIVQAVPSLRDYPDPASVAEVEAMIGQYHGVPAQRIMLVAGAAEAFAMLPRLSPAHPLVIHPGFSEPDAIFGPGVAHAVLDPPFDQLWAPDAADMVIVGNPTNPTGVLHDVSSLRAPGRILVVDEAFLDVVGEQYSMIPAQLDDVLCLRSLTKTWGIAGLRIGYVAGDPALLDRLRQQRAHWPVGTLQIAAARAVFSQGVHELPAIARSIDARRTQMQSLLEQHGFVMASDSRAPFVLVKPPCADAEATRQRLLGRGIAVRRCDTFPGLDLNHWRLAVKPPEDVQALLQAMQEIGALNTP
ncbi:Rv2231c family pyridoxal phosphate-dependent protein CobC [Corynebacterium pseudopelargi]|uniref:Rv2231c family pyridoxal phosphate-dependent protein CobC n=1 Tax=Corynebacterium pseudopelargi TaxID=2080757 RepID=UPI001FE45E3B|nr:Rv2231c family pyridoxal phosphate-dependent protein CobC [Corynebacterium pseudopelargi]